jgi:hypothetical protein
MIGSIALILSALIGGGVLVYTMKDFLIGFVRKIVLPAIKRIAVAAADIVLAVLQLIEGTVTYTAQAIRQVVNNFKNKVLGIVSNYQKISYNEVAVTTETFVMEGKELRKTRTNQRVSTDDVPDYIKEKLAQRNRVEMHHEEDLLNEVNRTVRV